jgi:hypothetical protein
MPLSTVRFFNVRIKPFDSSLPGGNFCPRNNQLNRRRGRIVGTRDEPGNRARLHSVSQSLTDTPYGCL